MIEINYIYLTLTFILGFILGIIFSPKKSVNGELTLLINEFKKSLDEYKNQNILSTKEVKNSLKDAINLAKILTTNQNLKGQFGEDCLEDIICACYPNKDLNYIRQFVTKNESNNQIKPDYLIKLPNQKTILIDCKLNLEKYVDFQNEDEPDKKNIKKSDFIKDLNLTINNLADKKYETAPTFQPDFILMYIPLEPIITLIYTNSEYFSVIKNATEKNIIIVGNSGILTAIRLTKLLWAQNCRQENLENIVNLAQKIYDSAAQHSQSIIEIKNIINESNEKINKEYEKLKNEGIFFKTVEELRSYGIDTKNKKNGKKISEIKIHSDFFNR